MSVWSTSKTGISAKKTDNIGKFIRMGDYWLRFKENLIISNLS